jgi:hypothetical protein
MSSAKQNNIRRYLTKNIVDVAQSVGGIQFPGKHVSTTITTAVEVGAGNVLRIVVTTAGWVAFGDSTVGIPSGATGEISAYLPVGTHYVYATNDYIRGSAASIAVSSVEVLNI